MSQNTFWAYSSIGKVVVHRNTPDIAQGMGYLYEVRGLYSGENIPRFEGFTTNALVTMPGVLVGGVDLNISSAPLILSDENWLNADHSSWLSTELFQAIKNNVLKERGELEEKQ